MDDYPLFRTPEWVDIERVKSWPEPFAIRYREWLVSVIESRVDILRSLLGIEDPSLTAGNIETAGLRAAGLLKGDPFSTAVGGGRKMTMWGTSLATDMGLYVAKCLFDCCDGKIYWITPRESNKDVSYNLPVIAGFGQGRLDPIEGSIAEAHGILRGRKDGRIWKDILEFWCARA